MRSLVLTLAPLRAVAAAVAGQAVLTSDEPEVETVVVEVEQDPIVVKAERK